MYFKSFAIFSADKILLYLEYSIKILVGVLSNSKTLICVYFLEYTSIFSYFRITKYTTKVFLSILNTAITNSFRSIIWTCLVIGKTLLIL